MRPARTYPTETSLAGALARKIAMAMGTAYNHADATVNSADALADADALVASRAQVVLAIAQAFVSNATVLLDELEAEYGLPIRRDMTNAERQARLVAKVRASRRGSPRSIENALVPIAGTATVLENLLTAVPIAPDGIRRGQWHFGVLISAAKWADINIRAQALAIIEQMKPAYTTFALGVTSPFLCDDPNSLVDRDLLGS